MPADAHLVFMLVVLGCTVGAVASLRVCQAIAARRARERTRRLVRDLS